MQQESNNTIFVQNYKTNTKKETYNKNYFLTFWKRSRIYSLVRQSEHVTLLVKLTILHLSYNIVKLCILIAFMPSLLYLMSCDCIDF